MIVAVVLVVVVEEAGTIVEVMDVVVAEEEVGTVDVQVGRKVGRTVGGYEGKVYRDMATACSLVDNCRWVGCWRVAEEAVPKVKTMVPEEEEELEERLGSEEDECWDLGRCCNLLGLGNPAVVVVVLGSGSGFDRSLNLREEAEGEEDLEKDRDMGSGKC
jgi:hypothetical protein